MRVGVLTTGQMEHVALHRSLQRVFPDHDFVAMPEDAEVASRGIPQSFTSSDVSRLIGEPGNNAEKLLQRAAAAALGDSRAKRKPLDLVLMVDDVELVNAHQPSTIVDVMRDCVDRHLEGLPTNTRKRTEVALRERVSLHLAMPMAEAWFFGDPQALGRAGVVPGTAVRQVGADVEAFETDDSRFLRDEGLGCQKWTTMPEDSLRQVKKKRKAAPTWLRENRNRHLKAYLAWLCRDFTMKGCTTYRETHEGAAALEFLDWRGLVAAAGACPFTRAMLSDIADALGTSPIWSRAAEAPETSRHSLPRHPVLRNL